MNLLKIERPLAVFDIEATGTSPQVDRIIDLCVIRLLPNQQQTLHNFRVNPGIPIPLEASRIHGIFDADVSECPPFKDVASEILNCFADADLCGYNLVRFDIPMLENEFTRAGLTWNSTDARVVDVQRIFHRKEPRDLSAAVAFYTNELHLDAHGAQPDVEATIRVLEGQFQRYHDLPRDITQLDEFCNPRDPTWVDKTGKFKWVAGEIVLNFGKKRGVTLKTLLREEPSFAKWMLRSDFPQDVKAILTDAVADKWPTPPSPDEED